MWNKFVKLNQKYDALAKTDPDLRFLLFFVPMVALLAIPVFLRLIFRVDVPTEFVMVMIVLILVPRMFYIFRKK